MASSPPSYQTDLPLPSASQPGDKFLDHEDRSTPVPIHIVTSASQLPVEFLEPSPQEQLVIGFDCEGVDLCRTGALCIMQVCYTCWPCKLNKRACYMYWSRMLMSVL